MKPVRTGISVAVAALIAATPALAGPENGVKATDGAIKTHDGRAAEERADTRTGVRTGDDAVKTNSVRPSQAQADSSRGADPEIRTHKDRTGDSTAQGPSRAQADSSQEMRADGAEIGTHDDRPEDESTAQRRDTGAPDTEADRMARDEPRTDRRAGERARVVDVDTFAEHLFEQGYRRGYLAGAEDARQQIAGELRRARMEERRETAAEVERRMLDDQRAQQRPGEEQARAAEQRQGETRADRRDRTRAEADRQRQGRIAVGPGGAIVILPQGVTPQAFIDRVMEDVAQDRKTRTDADQG